MHYKRTRFLFHFLYLLAPRVSEVVTHSMNSFREYQGNWWWFVQGEGGKRGKAPATDEMLDALIWYRRFLKLDCLPAENDTSPLLRSIKGRPKYGLPIGKERSNCHSRQFNRYSTFCAAKLKRSSLHWLRHTAVTHGDDAGIGMKYLNLSARHEKLETMVIYQHAEYAKSHKEWQQHQY